MFLNEYMKEKFPELELKPALFYQWPIGIRFELGYGSHENSSYLHSPYLLTAYQRATTLFEALHAQDDDILLVVHSDADKRTGVFTRYLKNKKLRFNVTQQTISSVFSEDDDGFEMQQFVLKCKKSDFNYHSLIKAICNHEMGIKPRLYQRIYFLNLNKETIFHIYDDRGCDLIATSPNAIQKIYQTYNSWILNYDRNKIDQVFK
jgi:hypothetical protein